MALAVIAVAALGLGQTAVATAHSASTSQHLTLTGHFTPRALVPGDAVAPSVEQIPPHSPLNKTLRHTSAAGTPNIAGNSITSANSSTGWEGVSHFDQRNAGTGQYVNTQFSLEPPDQGLCVGNGNVVEPVNNALEIYTTTGTPLTNGNAATRSIALSQFFGVAPEFVRPTGPFGPSIGDPKCYYDPSTNRFFLTELEFGVDPASGNFANTSSVLIAVTQTGDPLSTWNIYSFDTTDSGRNGCGCFGDQPLIGADANGFYISTNEYGISSSVYYGAQLYAISKAAVAAGASSPAVTHMDIAPNTISQGGLAYSVQPATSPNTGYATANNGTEYFVSTTDWSTGPAIGVRSNTIEVWALTNTASLGTTTPQLGISNLALASELYAQPPNAVQAPGPTPLATLLHDHLELIDSNDDRMNQVVYAGGQLWTAANTAVKPPTGPTVVGIAYFVVTPSDPAGTLSATISSQGYVGASGENVMFPSIGVTAAGKAVMAFSLVGPDFHPSAAYTAIGASPDSIHVSALGAAPDDGFSGYKAEGGAGHGRWGDYSAAVADTNGTIWMANEYISGGARTLLANWTTFVSHITP